MQLVPAGNCGSELPSDELPTYRVSKHDVSHKLRRMMFSSRLIVAALTAAATRQVLEIPTQSYPCREWLVPDGARDRCCKDQGELETLSGHCVTTPATDTTPS